jgi:hypothetical protein
MFRSPNRCTKVEGDISSRGYCHFFYARQRFGPGGLVARPFPPPADEGQTDESKYIDPRFEGTPKDLYTPQEYMEEEPYRRMRPDTITELSRPEDTHRNLYNSYQAWKEAQEPAPSPPPKPAGPATFSIGPEGPPPILPEWHTTIKRALGGALAFKHGGRVPHEIAAGLKEAEAGTDRNPTDAQKKAGNYAKGKLDWHGERIAIENPKGSIRSGVGPDGHKWSCKMPAAYGYLHGTEAIDGDHVDVYVGPDHSADKVWVIDQVDARSKQYDEPKAFLSFSSWGKARSCYENAFSDGRARDRIGGVTEMTIPQFKAWANSKRAKKPLSKAVRNGK